MRPLINVDCFNTHTLLQTMFVGACKRHSLKNKMSVENRSTVSSNSTIEQSRKKKPKYALLWIFQHDAISQSGVICLFRNSAKSVCTYEFRRSVRLSQWHRVFLFFFCTQ